MEPLGIGYAAVAVVTWLTGLRHARKNRWADQSTEPLADSMCTAVVMAAAAALWPLAAALMAAGYYVKGR